MTPAEEIAKELVEKYYGVIASNAVNKYDPYYSHAKQCASIAADTALKNIEATLFYHEDSKAIPHNKQFWESVKEAIQKL